MSAEQDVGNDEEGLEAKRQATSMQGRLSKEVASWSKERREQSGETVIVLARPVIQPRSRRPVNEARKSSVPSLAAKPPGERSKPFSMSYDGMTHAEYIQYLRDRGSR